LPHGDQPRSRGDNVVGTGQRPGGLPINPARAGITLGLTVEELKTSDQPRSRGDNGDAGDQAIKVWPRSTPLARG